MFKNFTLSAKIIGGFSLLLIMAVILGSLAIWNMWNVQSSSQILAEEYIPEVLIANKLEHDSVMAMYNMRGFGLSENDRYHELSLEHLGEVRKSLQDSKDLAQTAKHLVKLQESINTTEKSVNQYTELVSQTASCVKQIKTIRTALDEAAGLYMSSATELLDNQYNLMNAEITGASVSSATSDEHSPAVKPAAKKNACTAGPPDYPRCLPGRRRSPGQTHIRQHAVSARAATVPQPGHGASYRHSPEWPTPVRNRDHLLGFACPGRNDF
jgi:CHASE3 domain sensor protein